MTDFDKNISFMIQHKIVLVSKTVQLSIVKTSKTYVFKFFAKHYLNFASFFRLGSVAGPVIQATGRPEIEDGLRSGSLLRMISR